MLRNWQARVNRRSMNIAGEAMHRSNHGPKLPPLNCENPANPILSPFCGISDHRARRVPPLPGWERKFRATVGFVSSNQQIHKEEQGAE